MVSVKYLCAAIKIENSYKVMQTYLRHNVQSQYSFIHNYECYNGLQQKGHKRVDPKCQSIALHGEVGCDLKSKITKCL